MQEPSDRRCLRREKKFRDLWNGSRVCCRVIVSAPWLAGRRSVCRGCGIFRSLLWCRRRVGGLVYKCVSVRERDVPRSLYYSASLCEGSVETCVRGEGSTSAPVWMKDQVRCGRLSCSSSSVLLVRYRMRDAFVSLYQIM